MSKEKFIPPALPSVPTFEAEEEGFYIDIDCLFDTRFVLLSILDTEYAFSILEDGTYFNRQNDSFSICNYVDFKQYYEQRGENPELLRHAPLSNFHVALNGLMLQQFSQARKGTIASFPSIVINFYPYCITLEEVEEVCLQIASLLSNTVNVQGIWVDPKSFGPGAMTASRIVYASQYQLGQWIADHHEEMKSRDFSRFFVSGPELYLERIPTEEEIKAIVRTSKMTAFGGTEVAFAPFLGIQFMPVEFFCIYSEHRKQESRTKESIAQLEQLPGLIDKVISRIGPIEDMTA